MVKIKNLITGIGGFVASHLADYLLKKGEEVYGTYRWNENLDKIEHIKDKLVLIPANLNDMGSLIRAVDKVKPNFIFHLAAESYVTDSFIFPHEAISVNTLGTLNLLEAVRIFKDRQSEDYNFKYQPIIHVCSSSEVYGQVEEKDIPIKETQLFNPANPYAVGKIGADMLGLLYWKNYGLKIIRTRFFTHTGPRRSMDSAEIAFAKQIIRIEEGAEPIIKVGNLNSIRTFADVRDAVRACWLLVRQCKPGEVYNIGGNRTMSIGDMLNILIRLSKYKKDIKIEVDKNLLRPSDVTLQIPDISKFQKETGWKPEITLEQTLHDILEDLRKNV